MNIARAVLCGGRVNVELRLAGGGPVRGRGGASNPRVDLRSHVLRLAREGYAGRAVLLHGARSLPHLLGTAAVESAG